MIDNYDTNKLKEARTLIIEVYEYNYKSKSDPLSKRILTIINKLNKLIAEEGT